MEEHIEMELQNKKKNFLDAASIFSRKLLKWKQKHKEKKREVSNSGIDTARTKIEQFQDPQIQSEPPIDTGDDSETYD